ncbi:MAG: hypothetical protein A2161_01275 [Candidatus Schekmanbacteria bacterium RBG_13_48_7]|uniref:Cardiolipin synthase N-terminal domain-containing protein n=1 Tax=Candidatus Schekmanbacteria bacterium RBG_13_48_7 TaxID=1817878 RepID=A0A1F7S9G6_9BACT|nr:MAG: hypothetical protein A2161_01275 [Candidatus Schekmanbacteria bacterium RBG_13_48_7]
MKDPSLSWSIVLIFGFLGWIGSVFAFIFNAIDENDRLIKRKALFWYIIFVIFYALWIIGMRKA